ncbi:MAG: type VII toxin-antitoxin system HepT family RNase toxin [Candidatus Ratteibacteria bacterium]
MELPIPVKNRLEKLEIAIKKLKELKSMSLKDFLNDWKSQDSACRNFQISVEICVDIGSFILSEKKLPVPDIYSKVIEELKKIKIIEEDVENELKKLIRFRNIIVHEYLYIDFEKVYKNFSLIGVFEKFAKRIVSYYTKIK